MKWNAKARALTACFGLSILFTGFSTRLEYLHIVKHEEYAKLADEKHSTKEILYAPRGTISDVNGEVLAENVPIERVFADGSLVNNAAALAELLAKPLGREKGDVEAELLQLQSMAAQARKARNDGKGAKIPPGFCYRNLSRSGSIPEEAAISLLAEMKKHSLRGIFFQPDWVRVYPNGPMLCHVLGFTDSEHNGVDGIEKSADSFLRGYNGCRFFEHDRTGNELVEHGSREKPAMPGHNIRLTIDMTLQSIVEKELDDAVKQYRPSMASIIIMQPKTGEILAMSSRPNFDLGNIGESQTRNRLNFSVSGSVEPGSVFKIVAAGAAFSEKILRPDTVIYCEHGHFKYKGRTLHDHKPFDQLTTNDILARSSNVGAAKIGLMLGEQRLYDYARAFGFGDPTDVALPGEIRGRIEPPFRWSNISITRIPMGQEVCVTPLQLVTAMSVIANGGRLMMPQIIHEIADNDGSTVTTIHPVVVRQVISEEAARETRDALKGVFLKNGTAFGSAVPGFEAAGKTGTAQTVGPNKTYLPDKYVLSFAGMLPANDPQFVCLVMLHSPNVATREQNYGGAVSAPIFSRVAALTARHLNLVPVDPGAQVAMTQVK